MLRLSICPIGPAKVLRAARAPAQVPRRLEARGKCKTKARVVTWSSCSRHNYDGNRQLQLVLIKDIVELDQSNMKKRTTQYRKMMTWAIVKHNRIALLALQQRSGLGQQHLGTWT
jgi:hypothetical protein